MDDDEMTTEDLVEIMRTDAERFTFALLVVELERLIPEFSGRALREKALSALDGSGEKYGHDGEKWARAVVDRVIWDMIPSSRFDDEPPPQPRR